jgi:surface polysaccharide O-acyltransferase-like enzyme
MIIAHHFVVHSGEFPEAPPWSAHSLFNGVFEAAGKIGVDGYVLIAGYFVTSRSFTWAKLGRLAFETLTYSVILQLVFGSMYDWMLGPGFQVPMLFPLTFSVWWFATAYVGAFFFSGFVGRLMEGMDARQHMWLVVGGGVGLTLVPSFTGSSPFSTGTGGSLVWFIYLFFVAGYIRRHHHPVMDRRWLWLGVAAVFLALRVALPRVLALHPLPEGWRIVFFTEFAGENRLWTVVPAIALLFFFTSLRWGSIRPINVIASATFGVYLIHDHPATRYWLWQGLVRPTDHFWDSAYYLYAIGTVLAVFAACAVIDLVRQQVIERPALALARLLGRRWRQSRSPAR